MRRFSLTSVITALLILFGLAAGTLASPPPPMAYLMVHVADLRNRTGNLVFGLFSIAAGFPPDQGNSVNWQVKPAGGDATFSADLPPGTSADGVLHNEDQNGHIDIGSLGIPTEGYRVPDNRKPKRLAAKFDEATFTLPPGGTSVTISMQYDFV